MQHLPISSNEGIRYSTWLDEGIDPKKDGGFYRNCGIVTPRHKANVPRCMGRYFLCFSVERSADSCHNRNANPGNAQVIAPLIEASLPLTCFVREELSNQKIQGIQGYPCVPSRARVGRERKSCPEQFRAPSNTWHILAETCESCST